MSAKITFKKIRAKNFRSVGNMFMEIDYLQSNSTLVVSSDNGAGKSTLSIWALYYALFGKSYKKETKLPSLVNSFSGKDCVVELEFSAQGSEWMVRRGRKPDVFDIIRDGKRVEDEAALKDYQAYLQSVISMDDKAFEYIIALGPDKFVPFSELTAPQRRAFVEQILDITVISTMNDITKTRIKAIRKSAEQKYYDINMLESRVSGHKRTLGILENQRKLRLQESGAELATLQATKVGLDQLFEQFCVKENDLGITIDETVNKKVRDMETMLDRFKIKRRDLEASSKKYGSMTSCPTCLQCVTDEHKTSIANENSAAIAKLEGPQKSIEASLLVLNEKVVSNAEIAAKIAKINSAKVQVNAKLMTVSAQIKSIQDKLKQTNDEELIQTELDAITTIESSLETLNKEHQDFKVEEDNHNFFLLTLKDDAVKADIVRQYLPFLNQKINEYLDLMNLYIQMSLDEEFNMTMFAPNRKGQTIDNLSTGQLRRVDLAVLLAWREVARSKASVSSNLLILDEILENLSQQGVADFMELWETKYADKDINLFVISQRNAEFDEFFDRSITYALKDDKTVEI